MIREATVKDLPILLEFEQGVIRAERPFDPTIRPDPVLYYDVKELLSNDEALVLVAELNNRIVSCGYARIKEARPYLDHEVYAYLGFMFTDATNRGKGINGQMRLPRRKDVIQ